MAVPTLAIGPRAFARSTASWLMGATELGSPVDKGCTRMAAQNSSDAASKAADQCGVRWRSIVIRTASVAIEAQMRRLCFPTWVAGGKVEAWSTCSELNGRVDRPGLCA